MVSVPFCSLKLTHDQLKYDVEKAFAGVYQRGQFIMGSELEAFEKEYAFYSGSAYCVGVANGLDALTLSLRLAGIGPEDEVIVPAHTYIASWLAVTQVGARVVPIDVELHSMLMDTLQVEKAITKKTKAIMPVHLYGQACEMAAIMKLAERYHLQVIEDNAQAHGCSQEGVMTGNFGICNATSFYPTKNLGALGDGGALTMNSKTLHEKALHFRNYGSTEQFINSFRGVNSRLDELQAAILRIKLRNLEEWNRQRRAIAFSYQHELEGVGDLRLPGFHENNKHVYHLFVVRTEQRDELRSYLFQKGIGTMIHYPIPPHLQEAYADHKFKRGDFPIAEAITGTALSLPIWPGLSEPQQNWVITSIKNFYQNRQS